MPRPLGQYTTHLQQLWRLPNRVDEAAAKAGETIAGQLDAAAVEQQRILADMVRQLDGLINDQGIAGRTTPQAVAQSLEDLFQSRQDLVQSLRELPHSLREQLQSLRGDVDRLAASQAQTDHAALGLQRMRLRDRHGALDIETDHPVAHDSPDHSTPWGTARDNSRSQAFNARLINLIPSSRLSLLDLGCSGGGAVRSLIEQGFLAAGVEGSDYSQRRVRAEWANIPDFLFTADITKPFRILSDTEPSGVRFGVVTMWEVIEHIAEADLLPLFRNIDAHLAPNGVLILSVSPNSDVIDGQELHQTVEGRPWWTEKFHALGWTDHPTILAWFGNDLVRWEANAPNSFHFVLSRSSEVPHLTARARHMLTGVGAAITGSAGGTP